MEKFSKAEEGFSKKVTKRIKQTEKTIENFSYYFQIDSLKDDWLQDFKNIYEERIKKRGGIPLDIVSNIKARIKRGRKLETISLYKENCLLGGFVYSLRKNSLSAVYRTFPLKLPDTRLPISVSYLAELYFVDRALKLGKTEIIHGRDRNPYGVWPHSAIGLPVFKLLVGNLPFVSCSLNNVFQKLNHLSFSKNTLVFIGERPGERIQKAVFFANDQEEARKKYSVLFKKLNVEILSVEDRKISRK